MAIVFTEKDCKCSRKEETRCREGIAVKDDLVDIGKHAGPRGHSDNQMTKGPRRCHNLFYKMLYGRYYSF
ncbi:hypothetical protein EYF80_031640 [Liparis tanakae]|uniref:Uncharacterized protein n=1 Tax=Liparis tanakae TaxID=230148 RepID=A0A4Z2GWT8_9TELE|nr:hypothetical protein EYF80_031640 [Liparis tanakae]